MKLEELVTIVIPCKNEKDIIQKTLDLLNYQKDIWRVKVIVCDASNDGITKIDLVERLEMNSDIFDLYVMDGGLPSVARNNGFRLVKTPYEEKNKWFLHLKQYMIDNFTNKDKWVKDLLNIYNI